MMFCAFIVFLILKLTGVIDWSWWLIWSPMIVQALIYIGVIAYAVSES